MKSCARQQTIKPSNAQGTRLKKLTMTTQKQVYTRTTISQDAWPSFSQFGKEPRVVVAPYSTVVLIMRSFTTDQQLGSASSSAFTYRQ